MAALDLGLEPKVVSEPTNPSKSLDNIKVEPTTDKPELSKWEKLQDRIGANAQAAYTGVLSFGSTLAKITEKIDKGIHYGVTHAIAPIFGDDIKNTKPVLEGFGKEGQDAYNDASKIYNKPSALTGEDYPEKGVSKFAGELASSYPLGGPMMKAGSSLGGMLGGSGLAGQYLGGMLGGAGAGAAMGGLQSQPGQDPNQIINPQGAAMGAALGAPLGAAGTFLGNYGKTTSAYQVAKESMKDYGYKGGVIARDSGNEAVNAIKSKWMDNIPLLTPELRHKQLAEVTPAIQKLINGASKEAESNGIHRIGQILRGTENRMEKEVSTKWDDLYKSASQAGVKYITPTNSKEAAKSLLADYGTHLSKKESSVLATLSNAKSVSLDAAHTVKSKDLWGMYKKYSKIPGSVNDDIADASRNLYFHMDKDIGTSLSAVPSLESKWHEVNAFTKSVKTLFDPRVNRKMVNAIEDIHENTGALNSFVNAIVKPPTSMSTEYYNQAMGSAYKKTVETVAVNKIFNSTFDVTKNTLNLNSFFKGIESANAGHILSNPTVKAMNGLQKFTETVTKAQDASNTGAARHIGQAAPYMMGAAVGTGVATGMGATAVSALAGVKLLGMISKHSPLKNSLIMLSRVAGKNPHLTEKAMQMVGQALPRAGILMLPEGNDGIKFEVSPKGGKSGSIPSKGLDLDLPPKDTIGE